MSDLGHTVTIDDYNALVANRPEKFSEEEVGYQPAPPGSAIRCASCWHYYRRSTDGFEVCEIMRSEETDREGVKPDYRCQFQTPDGDVHLLLEDRAGW